MLRPTLNRVCPVSSGPESSRAPRREATHVPALVNSHGVISFFLSLSLSLALSLSLSYSLTLSFSLALSLPPSLLLSPSDYGANRPARSLIHSSPIARSFARSLARSLARPPARPPARTGGRTAWLDRRPRGGLLMFVVCVD